MPRLYEPEPTVEIAAVLLEHSRYGVTVDILKPFADELWNTDESMMYISSALNDINSYLQVSWKADPITGVFTEAEVSMFDDIDMHQLNTNFIGDKGNNPINISPSSSNLVNMTEVMTHVFVINKD